MLALVRAARPRSRRGTAPGCGCTTSIPYPHVDDVLPLMATGSDPALPRRAVPAFASRRAAPHEAAGERREEPRAAGSAGARSARSSSSAAPSSPAFPGETEAEFEHLLDFMREARIDRAGCFAYSPVDGASANELPGMLPPAVREERRARFMARRRGRRGRQAARARRRDDAGPGRFGAGARPQGRLAAAATPMRPRSTAGCACCRPTKASKTLKAGEFTRARIVAAAGPRPGRRCRSDARAIERHDRRRPSRRSTALIHHPYAAAGRLRRGAAGVHKASTVDLRRTSPRCARATGSEKTGYTYGLHGTPTTFTLEERIATLEGGVQTLLVPSGLAAITLVAHGAAEGGRRGADPRQRLRAGQGVRPPRARAAGASRIASTIRWIRHRSPRRSAERHALVWLEAPGSVTMEFPDLRRARSASRASGGVTIALDNTWGAGVAFDPFRSAPATAARRRVDISVQALTKYPSGGGDVLMGSVTTRDEALHLRLKFAHMRLGFGVGANDVELVLRSLPSLALRYEAQDRAGARARGVVGEPARGRAGAASGVRGIAGPRALEARCAAKQPGCSRSSSTSASRAAQVDAFVDSLRSFKIGYSWAGPVSLVVPYDLPAMRAKPRMAGHAGALLARPRGGRRPDRGLRAGAARR